MPACRQTHYLLRHRHQRPRRARLNYTPDKQAREEGESVYDWLLLCTVADSNRRALFCRHSDNQFDGSDVGSWESRQVDQAGGRSPGLLRLTCPPSPEARHSPLLYLPPPCRPYSTSHRRIVALYWLLASRVKANGEKLLHFIETISRVFHSPLIYLRHLLFSCTRHHDTAACRTDRRRQSDG
jgi:hypothetical protein